MTLFHHKLTLKDRYRNVRSATFVQTLKNSIAETWLHGKITVSLLLQYHWCNTDVPIKGRDVVDAPRDVIVFDVRPGKRRRELTDSHGPQKQRMEKRVRGWWLR